MGRDANPRQEQTVPHRSPTAGGSTKDAILDGAEALLAENEVATVTMRSIADTAGVDPASITYHFGGKMELMAALIRRRYTILREHQMSALTQLLAESEEVPTARELLDTVYRPWFELVGSGDPGWRSYSKLVASMSDSAVLDELVRDLTGQWEQTLTLALSRAYPDADEELISQAFLLTVGTSLFAVPPRFVGPAPAEPAGLTLSYPAFLHFISSGFESVVSAPS